MKLNVSFKEISEYVKARYGKNVVLERVARDEVRVTYEQKVLFTSAKVSVKVKIEDVRADGLTLSYDGGLGVDQVISGALAMMKSLLPQIAAVVVPEDGHRVRVELRELEQAQKALEVLALEDISVDEDSLTARVGIKS